MKSLKEAKMKEEAARMNKLREEAKDRGSFFLNSVSKLLS